MLQPAWTSLDPSFASFSLFSPLLHSYFIMLVSALVSLALVAPTVLAVPQNPASNRRGPRKARVVEDGKNLFTPTNYTIVDSIFVQARSLVVLSLFGADLAFSNSLRRVSNPRATTLSTTLLASLTSPATGG